MGAVDSAAAEVEGRAVPGVGGDVLGGDGGADDVYDGIFGADLVKVDRLGIAIVNLGLGGGEEGKGAEGEIFSTGTDGGTGDNLANFGESAMGVRM